RKSWLSARALSTRSWVSAPSRISRSTWDCSRSSVSIIRGSAASRVPRAQCCTRRPAPHEPTDRAPAVAATPRHPGMGTAGAGIAAGRRRLLLRLSAREVGGGPLLALRGDLAIRDQLADRQGEVLGRGPQLLVDLLDAQAGVCLDERGKLLRQH